MDISATQGAFFFKAFSSPVGTLRLVANHSALCAILWQHDKPKRVPLGAMEESSHHPVLLAAEQQLTEYFAGTRTSFSLPLHFQGTPFQQQVWQQLLAIPYGATCTYLQIAQQLGNPGAVRAVGAANGRNPISIIAPCHRVIGSSGMLTGFAGGLHNKAFLLKLEGHKPTGTPKPSLQLDMWDGMNS